MIRYFFRSNDTYISLTDRGKIRVKTISKLIDLKKLDELSERLKKPLLSNFRIVVFVLSKLFNKDKSNQLTQ